MDTDTTLVLGLIIGALAIPSMMAAFADSRPPRLGALLVLISGTLLVIALSRKPDGYAIAEIPQAFVRVLGRFVN
jgi:hypothetical protein